MCVSGEQGKSIYEDQESSSLENQGTPPYEASLCCRLDSVQSSSDSPPALNLDEFGTLYGYKIVRYNDLALDSPSALELDGFSVVCKYQMSRIYLNII